MRVFISGPISGMLNLNRDAFEFEAILLKQEGCEVFSPFSITPPSEEARKEWGENAAYLEWNYYMRVCVGQIPLCDRMHMLPGWQNSKGAVWEHRIAEMLGLEITYSPVLDPNPKW